MFWQQGKIVAFGCSQGTCGEDYFLFIEPGEVKVIFLTHTTQILSTKSHFVRRR